MAIILVETDAADIATAFGASNPGDTIRLEAEFSEFTGANNRNNSFPHQLIIDSDSDECLSCQ